MFSKSVLRKMVGELSVPMLVTLIRETIDGIGEELNEDAVSNVELFAAEMRRRIAPVDEPTRRRGRQPRQEQQEQNADPIALDV